MTIVGSEMNVELHHVCMTLEQLKERVALGLPWAFAVARKVFLPTGNKFSFSALRGVGFTVEGRTLGLTDLKTPSKVFEAPVKGFPAEFRNMVVRMDAGNGPMTPEAVNKWGVFGS